MYGSRVMIIVAGDDDDSSCINDDNYINDGNIHWYRVKVSHPNR